MVKVSVVHVLWCLPTCQKRKKRDTADQRILQCVSLTATSAIIREQTISLISGLGKKNFPLKVFSPKTNEEVFFKKLKKI